MNVVVEVALADGPHGNCGFADWEPLGILFRLRMWMMTTQMMSRTMTMTAERSAPRKTM